MSEFKFACPVCGQHITADSSTSGGQIECPTCFQKIVVPQAPSSPDTKFILSASQVGKPRPTSANGAQGDFFQTAPAAKSGPLLAGLIIVLCVAGALLFVFREKIFKSDSAQKRAETKNAPGQKAVVVPRTVYPIPTNLNWMLDLTNAVIPETTAAGRIHTNGFWCERAILQGGNLTLRQGRSGAPDLGISVILFAKQGEELSGKTIEVSADRAPPLPRVVVRWKDEQQKAVNQNISSGYALKLVFGEADNSRIPGRIYLCVPDDAKSFVAGTFSAEIRKPPPPKAPNAPKPKG